LRDYFGPLRLFGYITFRSAYAAVFAILLVLIFGRKFINLMKGQAATHRIRVAVF
jgi:hypothetical protein